jgi:hypothetical protein
MTDDKGLIAQAAMVVFSNYPEDQVDPPSYGDPEQIWAMFSQESPLIRPRSKEDLSKWNGVFNWTITYRLDSDIPVLLAEVKRKQKSSPTDRVSLHSSVKPVES